ncbi:nuclear transport factor 2 family protein [Azospirillum sp. B510]|uniref:nuclear transport factor 2 family protein n=1 Tax=Azospirillum sp. (strain B510) TaxID=137722 RepID=UPI001FFF8ABC|nr:nuclear transport factor 2 family protein [Azospirillum sp. B510]
MAAVLAPLAVTRPAMAQEAVAAASDAEALFTSPDPALNANKQVVYAIIRDLLEAGHWDKADRYLSEEYVQHNPNAASGRAAVVAFFTKVLQVKPQPIPARLKTKIVSVTAEGDLVIVAYPRQVKDPKHPAGGYSTTWFDMWRIRDGKAVEHWDPALVGEVPDLR